MFETGKAGQLARQMKRYKLDILGISECRWRGSGKSKLDTGEVIIYSDVFQYKCMKRILRIRWPRTTSQVQETTGVNRTSDEIRRRRWNWIGNIMRKNREEHGVTALEWRPEGRRRPGRPKSAWRRMVEDERRVALAANQSGWQENVKAFFALWHEEI